MIAINFVIVLCFLVALGFGEVVKEVQVSRTNARAVHKQLAQLSQNNHRAPTVNKNLRKAAKAVSSEGVFVQVNVHDHNCQAPVALHHFYSPSNPMMTSPTDFSYMSCAADTGKVMNHECTQTIPGSPPTCVETDLGNVGDCIDGGDGTSMSLDCVTDGKVLKQYTDMEAKFGFLNFGDANSGDFSKMQFMTVDYDLDRVLPLSKDERMECNTDLTAAGVCADTRKTKSFAYFAKDWQQAYLNLYPRSRGRGLATVIEYTEDNNMDDFSQVHTWRYLVKGWYENHFVTNA